ncbi:hypothetical protein N431DRAFT_406473 [Stipitochalara longipes BDJ]|nr:hypothetical protein N431DRAFT_406473 [Stipitochalara longipes BDJ]
MATADREIADFRPDQSSNGRSNGKKRKFGEDGHTETTGHTMSPLPQPDLPKFNLTLTKGPSQDSESPKDDEGNSSQDWQTVEHRAKKKAKKIPKAHSKNYPSIQFSKECRLNSQIKISDLQSLVLYILADGHSPQFVSVRHRPEIRKVVVLMVPGLEKSMFDAKAPGDEASRLQSYDRSYISPDQYYPDRLKADKLPDSLEPFADMFEHIWPVRTPGDDKYGKMHSPLHAMLTAPLPKSREEKNWNKNKKGATPAKEPHGWKNSRTSITEFIHPAEILLENDYTLHLASYDKESDKRDLIEHRKSTGVSEDHGWVDTLVKSLSEGTSPEDEIEAGSITAGRNILAMDCEMCMTGETEFSLTRISLVGWDGSVVMDELVKPAKPITNYVTQYSGITEQMLAPVTTTLQDIQKKLLEILTPRTILIGHSLNSDLTALKITHPFIIDTAVIYPHPRGPPLKSSLKWLASKYLNREIQKGHGTTGPGAGHDSIEDARTCLDLVKQKCEKGKEWGTSDAQGENIFKRVARTGVKYKNQGGSAVPSLLDGKSSAAIDWGDPRKGPGAAANFPIGCKSDEEVMEGVIRAVKGDPDGKEIPGGGVDFVWARFRELEALKGWWNNNKVVAFEAAVKDQKPAIDANGTSKPVPGSNPFSGATSLPSNPFLPPTDANMEGKDVPPPDPMLDVVVSTTSLPPPATTDTSKSVSEATAELTRRIVKIHDELPPCTAFIIYSGSGDPREMSRLQAMNAQFKREYKIKKWDQLSVQWTDVEEQALKKALAVARDGVGFIGVK